MGKVEDLSYYASAKKVTDLELFKNEFEIWLNGNKQFMSFWEGFFGDIDFITDEYITFDQWAKSSAKSLLINPEDPSDYLIHPQVLMAYSLDDPLVKLNLVVSIFELPKDILKTFLDDVFGIE